MAAPRVRITALYDKSLSAGPQLDLVVTKGDASTVKIPVGTSKSFLVSDLALAATATITAGTTASAQTQSMGSALGGDD